jgi:thiamine monophosphate kinase
MAVARRALEKNGVRLTVVGRVEARRGIRLQFRGKRVSLEGGGYEHFR